MGFISKKIDSLIDAMNEYRKELRLKNDFIKMDGLPHDEDGKSMRRRILFYKIFPYFI